MYLYKFFFNFFILSVIVLSFDYIYIYLIKNYVTNMVFTIQKSNMNFNILAAILCYICIIFSILFFIVREKKSPLHAGILGFVIYGIFDLTNKVMFDLWSWMFVIIDSLWGFSLYYLSVLFFYYFS